MLFIPQKIYVENKVKTLPLVKKLINSFSNVSITYLNDYKTLIREIKSSKHLIDLDEKILLLTSQKGRFLKKCPCTKKHIGCNYYVINQATNCFINCSYCILQSYLTNPLMIIYANTDDLFVEVENMLSTNRLHFYRIGTGELTDSLAIDNLTNFSSLLIPFFAKQENAVLELKTKTDTIDNLLNLNHRHKTIVSWSLAPPKIINSEEKNAPTLEKRLLAAKKCIQSGYKVGFHLDPLIFYPDWEKDYQEVIKALTSYIQPKHITWFSLGSFRFQPALLSIIKKRFPQSKIISGEFIPGLDGKMRYFKPIRIMMYKKIFNEIKRWNKDIFVYLCMESSSVWQRVFGFVPTNEQLGKLLDMKAKSKF